MLRLPRARAFHTYPTGSAAALNEDSAWFEPPERDYAGELNLRRALGSLPDDQKEVIVLHVFRVRILTSFNTALRTQANK
jgi:DNA-directed RNA polymerase specialized sigma24 family protein